MQTAIDLDGEVVERQTYLNGTVYLVVEAASDGGSGWTATLAVTLPKEEGEPVEEGDLALAACDTAWYGLIARGAHHQRWDDATDASYTEVRLSMTRNAGADSTAAWETVELVARLAGEHAALAIQPG